MFGVEKNKRMRKRWETIGGQLRDLLAFPRSMNDDRIPDTLKYDHYVLRFHFMMCLNLYIESVKGRTDPEEQGFILINVLAIALESDAQDIDTELTPLMANPDDAFSRGAEHANLAYEMLVRGDQSAFEEFNRNIRNKYR